MDHFQLQVTPPSPNHVTVQSPQPPGTIEPSPVLLASHAVATFHADVNIPDWWKPSKDSKGVSNKELWSSDVGVQDIIRLAKHHYVRPSVKYADGIPAMSKPLEKIVRSRTLHPCGYASQVPSNMLELRDARRKDVLEKGQLSQYAKPYIELGKVEPPSRLFVDNISENLAVNILEILGKKEDPTIKQSPSRENIRKHQTVSEDQMDTILRCELNDRENNCWFAGLEEIRVVLQETKERMQRMAAGDSFISHIKKCQERRHWQMMELDMLTRTDDMKVQELGSTSELAEKESISTLPWRKQRILHAFGNKLYHIYLLLCSMLHLKHRYLRNRTILSYDQIKSLRKDPDGNPIKTPNLEKILLDVVSTSSSESNQDRNMQLPISITFARSKTSRLRPSSRHLPTIHQPSRPPNVAPVPEVQREWSPMFGLSPRDVTFPKNLGVLKGGPKGHYGLHFRLGSKTNRAQSITDGASTMRQKAAAAEAQAQDMEGKATLPNIPLTDEVGKLKNKDLHEGDLGAFNDIDLNSHMHDRSESVDSSVQDNSSIADSQIDHGPPYSLSFQSLPHDDPNASHAPPQGGGSTGGSNITAMTLRKPSNMGSLRVTKRTSQQPNGDIDGKKKAEPTVETWEDLLNIQTGTARPKFTRKKALPAWQTLMHQAMAQQQAQNQNTNPQNPEKKKSDLEEHMDQYHPHEAMNRIRVANILAREELQNNVRREMEKYDRERLVKFCYKLRALDQLCPLFEQQLEYQDYLHREAARDPVFVTEETCSWYEELNKEATNLQCRSQEVVSDLLLKIWGFVLSDIQLLPYLKAKLCLLIMSMPAYEVCQPHWQIAIKFVLMKVIGGQEDLFKEWMEQRGLFVVDDSSDKNSVAGKSSSVSVHTAESDSIM